MPEMDLLRQIDVVETRGWEGYELIDSGEGRKLERFGEVIVDRPEPQALWRRGLGVAKWQDAHAVFSASGEDEEKGRWRIDRPVPPSWPVKVDGVDMLCRLQGLWHVGLFPEQLAHWRWMTGQLARVTNERPRVLNLFGYTGAASLIAAAAGAEVTHVDASKKAIQWGRENQTASGLEDKPVRWILDDASKYVAREVRRERTYHMILVDPPKFGRGPKNETWDLFTDLPKLLDDCARLVVPKGPAGLILTAYAIRASVVSFSQLTQQTLEDAKVDGASNPASWQVGELALRPNAGGYRVPTSLFVRWVR